MPYSVYWIHQWVNSTFCQIWIMLLWTFMYKIFHEHVSIIIFGIYLGMESMDFMVSPCLSFLRTTKTVSGGCTILYSHQHHPCVPISLANTTFCFLIVAIARGVRQCSGPLIHVLSELYLTSETLRQQLPLTGHAALWWVAKLQGHKGSNPSSALYMLCDLDTALHLSRPASSSVQWAW